MAFSGIMLIPSLRISPLVQKFFFERWGGNKHTYDTANHWQLEREHLLEPTYLDKWISYGNISLTLHDPIICYSIVN